MPDDPGEGAYPIVETVSNRFQKKQTHKAKDAVIEKWCTLPEWLHEPAVYSY